MRMLLFFLVVFNSCKSIDHKEAALVALENCINLSSYNIDSLNRCFNGEKYTLQGYTLKDSIFYVTDYINEPTPIDSVPAKVKKAFLSKGKSCGGFNVCETGPIYFKVERRFWGSKGVDSVYNILRIY